MHVRNYSRYQAFRLKAGHLKKLSSFYFHSLMVSLDCRPIATVFQIAMITMQIAIEISILLKRNSKAKRMAPAYS